MNKKLAISILFLVLSIVFIVLIKTVDVAAIGPESTRVGFASLNQAIHNATGVHMGLYKLTDYMGYMAILAALVFAFAGFLQMIKRRGILKVDGEILAFGGLLIVTLIVYVFFEVVVVNYRPVIMPDATEVEASFPSSHTMLVCVKMGGIAKLLKTYVADKKLRKVLKIACIVFAAIVVLFRLLSGVHWFTDIIGGLLISAALYSAFEFALLKVKK